MGVNGGVHFGKPGSRRFYAHGYSFLDLKPEPPSRQMNVSPRRGVTIRGQVVGPDGQPVQTAWMFSRIILASPATG